ncbi:MAG: helix-turn-helix domain-containing protein, partial [Myxococcota bacterium]
SHAWPGNVRELRNVVERLVLLGPSDVVRVEDLPSDIRWGRKRDGRDGCPFELPEDGVELESVERGLIEQALERTEGNQSAAARLLGLTRYQLRYRVEKHGLG